MNRLQTLSDCVVILCVATIIAAQTARTVPAANEKPTFVWIEGEATTKTNVPWNGWIMGQPYGREHLSRGKALAGMIKKPAADPGPKPCYAHYQFDCPAGGSYTLFMHHGYMDHLGVMRYRFIKLGDDGKAVKGLAEEEGWREYDVTVPILDKREIGHHRQIQWTRQEAPITLEKGAYALEIQFTGPSRKKPDMFWILIDAICLTTDPFTPSGVLKPGEKPDPTPAPAEVEEAR